MISHHVKQGSVDWLLLRAGVPTASEFSRILTPKFATRTGEMPHTYLASKIAEWWLGGPLAGFGSWSTDQGQLLEAEAIPWLELEFGWTISRPGFITTDDKLIGCSPDGVVGYDFGVEIKCPEETNHVKYLLSGDVPEDYLAQVHGSMHVTGLKKWKFVSYRRHFPALVVTVEKDDAISEKISNALDVFIENFEAAKARMEELNGGPRPVRPAYVPEAVPENPGSVFQPDPDDIIP
jgi:hypothetical protein